MDRYDSLYARERRAGQDLVLTLVRNSGFLAPAKLARDAVYQRRLAEAALEQLLRSADGTDRWSARRETVRHRLGALLIRLGTALQGASTVVPGRPSPAGAAASGLGR